jgi:hypothetical protein
VILPAELFRDVVSFQKTALSIFKVDLDRTNRLGAFLTFEQIHSRNCRARRQLIDSNFKEIAYIEDPSSRLRRDNLTEILETDRVEPDTVQQAQIQKCDLRALALYQLVLVDRIGQLNQMRRDAQDWLRISLLDEVKPEHYPGPGVLRHEQEVQEARRSDLENLLVLASSAGNYTKDEKHEIVSSVLSRDERAEAMRECDQRGMLMMSIYAKSIFLNTRIVEELEQNENLGDKRAIKDQKMKDRRDEFISFYLPLEQIASYARAAGWREKKYHKLKVLERARSDYEKKKRKEFEIAHPGELKAMDKYRRKYPKEKDAKNYRAWIQAPGSSTIRKALRSAASQKKT